MPRVNNESYRIDTATVALTSMAGQGVSISRNNNTRSVALFVEPLVRQAYDLNNTSSVSGPGPKNAPYIQSNQTMPRILPKIPPMQVSNLVNKKKDDPPTKRAGEWYVKFAQLQEYKRKHGHTNVAWNDGSLGTWVSKQRQQYRLRTENRESQITEDRIIALDAIGFSWSLYNKWDDKYEELLRYKEEHGHTNVPKSYGSLGVWVGDQRTQLKLLKKNRYSRMTIERYKMLESIGFVWSLFSQWGSKFEALVRYKEANGHTNVPVRAGSLGAWVGNQRTQYRFLQAGKRSSMTEERIQMLESIGFIWSLR